MRNGEIKGILNLGFWIWEDSSGFSGISGGSGFSAEMIPAEI